MPVPQYRRPPTPPDIEAEITLFASRKYPVFSGYRPIHDFGIPGSLNDAQHEYPDTHRLDPGAVGRALLWFVWPEGQAGRLYPGFEFTVQDGAGIVGRGKIVQVLNERLRRGVSQAP
jgi:hypothetical protein